jgi:serine/threonine protein kinase
MSLQPGIRLGPYEIVSHIGAGGMGEVYKARDTRLDRVVAVKVLPELFAADPDRAARFEREAQAVAALSHPNILAIHDVGTAASPQPGRPRVSYAVMELLEGETLRERLGEGALPLRQVIDYSVQFARGLAAAHDRGIVHRDLKPENLFVTSDERCKILDFGLARRETVAPAGDATVSVPRPTDPGTVMGTVGYMAPEQVRGEPGDQRSDIFAFGAVLYEMLTSRRAFQRDTAAEPMTAILREEPAALSGSAGAVRRPRSTASCRIVSRRNLSAGSDRRTISPSRSRRCPDPRRSPRRSTCLRRNSVRQSLLSPSPCSLPRRSVASRIGPDRARPGHPRRRGLPSSSSPSAARWSRRRASHPTAARWSIARESARAREICS